MTKQADPNIDWTLTTWKGSRRKQHEDFRAIPFSRKLEILEEMNRFALETIDERRERGLPYIDPFTSKLVPGRVREEPPLPTPNRENS